MAEYFYVKFGDPIAASVFWDIVQIKQTDRQTNAGKYPTLETPVGVGSKWLSYHRGTARRAMAVEILSTATQQYENSHLKRLTIVQWPSNLLKVIASGAIR